MKIFSKFALLASALLLTGTVYAQDQAPVKIGIVLPLDHMAMREITQGFEDQLRADYKQPVEFKVQNAQHDMNLQRSILQQMHDENYTMIVPVGTAATQMAVNMIKNQPIISLASDLSEADRSKMKPCNVVAVHDEIAAGQSLAFLHAAYPQIKNIALVHSADDKVFPEVKDAQQAAAKLGMTVKAVMVQTLPDLTSATQALPADTQAIFVLKDSMIVSGIDTLAQAAAQRHIPLYTSDQGSVQQGAGFALGVHERQIGIDGGKLAAQVLMKKDICSLPMVDMTHLTVFVNDQALAKAQQDNKGIIAAAKQMNYQVETVTQAKE